MFLLLSGKEVFQKGRITNTAVSMLEYCDKIWLKLLFFLFNKSAVNFASSTLQIILGVPEREKFILFTSAKKYFLYQIKKKLNPEYWAYKSRSRHNYQ